MAPKRVDSGVMPMRRYPWRPGDDPSKEPTLRDIFFWHMNGGTDWINPIQPPQPPSEDALGGVSEPRNAPIQAESGE